MIARFFPLPAVLAATMLSACNSLAPGLHLDDSDFSYSKDVSEGETPEITIVTITPEVIAEQLVLPVAEETTSANAVAELSSNGQGYDYRVAAGDVLAINIWGRPELSTPLQPADQTASLALGADSGLAAAQPGHVITQDGSIYFPFAGEIKVTGMTLREVRRSITSVLSEYIRNPQLDVRVQSFRSQNALVTGPGVVKPGLVPITDVPLSVLDAIGKAGGMTPEANASAVKLTRDAKNAEVDVAAMDKKADYSQNWILRAGDVVYVPSNRDQRVYVMGEVNRQAAVPMQNGRLSLADALADTGGLNPLASDARRLYIIRDGATPGTPKVFHLNARSPEALLLSTQFALLPRDVVYVSSASVTRFNRLFSQILPSLSFVRDLERLTAQ